MIKYSTETLLACDDCGEVMLASVSRLTDRDESLRAVATAEQINQDLCEGGKLHCDVCAKRYKAADKSVN